MARHYAPIGFPARCSAGTGPPSAFGSGGCVGLEGTTDDHPGTVDAFELVDSATAVRDDSVVEKQDRAPAHRVIAVDVDHVVHGDPMHPIGPELAEEREHLSPPLQMPAAAHELAVLRVQARPALGVTLVEVEAVARQEGADLVTVFADARHEPMSSPGVPESGAETVTDRCFETRWANTSPTFENEGT